MADESQTTESYGDRVVKALRSAAKQEYPALRDRVADMARTVARVDGEIDIVLLLAAVDEFSMAADAVAAAAKALHDSADVAMVQAMIDTGCTAVAGPHHTVSLRDGVPSVDIVDSKAVPAEFMAEREPIPDKRAIGKMLKVNGAVNWARLLPGSPGLMRRGNTQ